MMPAASSRLTRSLLLAFLLLLAAPVFAATYYVDSVNGADSNMGTTPSAAWQSLAKINATPLSPGDTVYFVTNSVWHEQLTVNYSGTSSASINFTAYGSGRMPIIDGGDVVGGFTQYQTGANTVTYFAPFTSKAYKATPLPASQPIGSPSSNTALPAPSLSNFPVNSIYTDGNYLYYQVASGNTGIFQSPIEVTTRPYNIVVTNQTYLVFTGLELIRAGRSGFMANTTIDNTSGPRTNEYIAVNKCVIYNFGNFTRTTNGIDVGPDGGFGGIYVYPLAVNPQNSLRGWTVTNNTCSNADGPTSLTYFVSCIGLNGVKSPTIKGNTITAGPAFGMYIAAFYQGVPCRGAVISNNDISASQGNLSIAGCQNVTISGNRIHDSTGYGIGLGAYQSRTYPLASTGALITGNTISNLKPTVDGTLYNGIDCNVGASGGEADNNTISGVAGNNITLEADPFYDPSTGSYYGNPQPCSGWTLNGNTFDASNNTTYNGQAPGRTGPVYIRDLATSGLQLTNNTYVNNSNYMNGMTYGFTSAGDLSHDLTLTQFEAVAPNNGGAASGSR